MDVSQSVAEKLLEKGLVSADQFSAARSESLRSGLSIEEVLQNEGTINGIDIARVKGEIYNIPFVDLLSVSINPDAISKLSQDVVRRYNVLPFDLTEKAIKVAMLDPLDIQTINYLSKIAGLRILPHYTGEAALNKAINLQYGERIVGQVTKAIAEAEEGDVPQEIEESLSDVSRAQEEISRAPVARILNMLLEFAVKSGTSDVHIEPHEEYLRVRFRINGVLVQKLRISMTVHPALVSRVKILAKLKIDEKRVPQDGRFMVKIKEKEIDLRISTLPTVNGEKVVIRLLERKEGGLKLETSGLRGSAFKTYVNALDITSGIILITGPTGSGKTQTLASSLMRINKEGINIITLENPVEIRISGVNQVQINPDAELTFATGLRSILRQDPDVIMVGEIRDTETGNLAIQASLTGHLVFSTLHTNTAAGALPRLLDMHIEPYLIASTVNLVVAQRLPRRICKHCIESYIAPPEVVRSIHKMLDNLQGIDIIEHSRSSCKLCKAGVPCAHKEMEQDNIPDKDQLVLFRGKGCNECEGSGYGGRVGIFEVLKVTETIGNLIMEHKPSGVIEARAREEGMITMVQDGYLKALEGVTTIEEVLRVSKT